MNDSLARASAIAPIVHLNSNVRGLGQSATLAINERSAELIAAGREVFRLGLGQSPFPVPLSVQNELRANAHQKDYLPVMGLPALRSAVAEFHRRGEGIDYSAADVLIGPGSKELMFLLQLTYYGDLVIPTPSWVSYAPQAQIIGRHIHWVPGNPARGWRISAADLDELCARDPERPRLVTLNYPNNPTGTTYGENELRDLAQVARRYRIVLLSDEIYAETLFAGRHISIAQFYPEGTIISSGLSKWCGAGGWRLGTFTFPAQLRKLLEAMAVVASETYTSVSAPIQYAAVCAFRGGPELEYYLRDTRRILQSLSRHFVARLRSSGADVSDADGGFYLFPDFSSLRGALARRQIGSSGELCERLLAETGIAMLPGSAFGRPHEELTARLAYVDFDGARALTAAQHLPVGEPLGDDFLEMYCPKMTAAAERLCRWLEQ